jgi:hypothetical protein
MVSRRAIIMEMSEKHLIVLTPSGEFRRVTRSVHTGVDIGDEIECMGMDSGGTGCTAPISDRHGAYLECGTHCCVCHA